MTLKDKIWCYIYHKLNQLEKDKDEVKYILRNRPIDSLDMYEQLRSEIRIEAFNEFVHDLMSLIINQDNKG